MTLSIRNKILLGLITLVLLNFLVLAISFFYLIGLGRSAEGILKENYESIEAVRTMERAQSRQHLLLSGPSLDRSAFPALYEAEMAFMEGYHRAQGNLTLPGEGPAVEAVGESHRRIWMSLIDSMSRASTAAGLPFDEAAAALAHLEGMNRDAMFAASERALQQARRAVGITGLLGGLSLLGGILFGSILPGRIVRPLRRLLEGTEKVGEGHYPEVPVEGLSGDEIGQLALSFTGMVRELRRQNEMKVSQLLAATNKSRSIIAAMDDGLVVVDGRLVVTDINPSAARMLDLAPERTLGRHIFECLSGEELQQKIKETVETGRSPKTIPFDHGTDQRNLLLELSLIPIRNGGEPPVPVLIVFRDVTQRVTLDRAKSDFIARASHELRTPLTSALMSLDLLREHLGGGIEGEERQLLIAADEDLHRLRSLVDDLLDLSRLEAGQIVLSFEEVSLDVIADDVLKIMAIQLEEKDLSVTSRLDDHLPLVRIDPSKIAWVLTNLIANALRHTQQGGQIDIGASAMGRWIRVDVTDNGEGIAEDDQARIFEKFAQVSGQRTGTGLGLPICREILRAHGGAIWVRSSPGSGSTFSFTVPAASAGEERNEGEERMA